MYIYKLSLDLLLATETFLQLIKRYTYYFSFVMTLGRAKVALGSKEDVHCIATCSH